MHILAYGISRTKTGESAHHYGILEWQLNFEWYLILTCSYLKDISEYRRIYPQLVEVELVWTIGVHYCVYRNKLIEVKLTLLWGTLREVSPQLLTLIESEFGHWIHRSYLIEFIPRLCCIYIIVGEWYRSHICGRLPYLRCISCSRRKDQSAEFSKFDHCYKLLQAYQNIILYWLIVRSSIVVFILLYIVWFVWK